MLIESVRLLLGRKSPVMSVSEGFVGVRFVSVVFVQVPDQPPEFFGVGRDVSVVKYVCPLTSLFGRDGVVYVVVQLL